MNIILAFLVLFYVVAFVYDKIIDGEIINNPMLASSLTEFKFFHTLQSRPKALYAILSCQYTGVSMRLTFVGGLFSIMMYSGLILGAYFLFLMP